jgi:hypothetical protein
MRQQLPAFDGSPLSASADLSICVGTTQESAGYNRPSGMRLLDTQPAESCWLRYAPLCLLDPNQVTGAAIAFFY